MSNPDTVTAARRALGPVGAFLPSSIGVAASVEQQRDAVRRLERAGYRATWVNEGVGGKDVFAQLGVLLSATERMVFGTSIANVWARAAQTAHGGAALLADAFPGRFVLGLGVGYPEQARQVGREFGRPLTVVRDYLAAMDAPGQMPASDAPYPRLLAAIGPKMLRLAGELTDGALPVLVPPAFVAQAREVLGPDKLLVVGLNAVTDPDPDRARAAAREFVSTRFGRTDSSYARNLLRLGYTAEELSTAADRVVDDLVAFGTSGVVAARAREFLAAGADHVLVMPTVFDTAGALAQLEAYAPELSELIDAPAV